MDAHYTSTFRGWLPPGGGRRDDLTLALMRIYRVLYDETRGGGDGDDGRRHSSDTSTPTDSGRLDFADRSPVPAPILIDISMCVYMCCVCARTSSRICWKIDSRFIRIAFNFFKFSWSANKKIIGREKERTAKLIRNKKSKFDSLFIHTNFLRIKWLYA